MKKTISLIAILSISIILLLSIKIYAEELSSINIDTDKTTVRPGGEVTLTINFGEELGAYTFDIAYDNNIFEYVSVDGGTANDTSDKVRVTFYDSTGGTNPRSSMSIVFKAKEGITTSNPTELTVTGEGLANSDASVTYDDITTPLVKNITVEPEYKDYTIELETTGSIIAGKEQEMVLSYFSEMGRYYEHARLIAEATTPEGASVQLIGIDADTQAEQDIIQSGWGDPQGYKIGGENVYQTLNLTALFSDAGEYTITLKLIDRDNSDTVIAKTEKTFTVIEEQTETEQPEEGLPTEEEDNETIVEEETSEEQTTEEQTPTQLPKTGNNKYIIASTILAGIVSFSLYYNRKK